MSDLPGDGALAPDGVRRTVTMFYKTENGAQVGDLFMSLIHTCELNEVDPLDYLVAALRSKDDLEKQAHAWMPWNYAADRNSGADGC
jgi:hypothetical protein